MDAHADVPLPAHERLARVESHADANGSTIRPPLRGECALAGHGGGDGVPCARESDEERVALRVDLVVLELRECRTQQACVGRKDLVVGLAELSEQPCRPLDVREEERDRSGRAVNHLARRNPIATERKAQHR
jgi:hypothetical protein